MSREALITIGVLTIIIGAALAYVFFGTSGFSVNSEPPDVERFLESKTPLEQSPYTDLAGNPVSLASYRGKVLVVNSWASWCPFCGTELQKLNTVAMEFSSEEVVFLAINRMETVERAERYMRQQPGTFDNLVLVLDHGDVFYRRVGGFSMPETLFYDSEGELVAHERGQLSESRIKELVSQALSADE